MGNSLSRFGTSSASSFYSSLQPDEAAEPTLKRRRSTANQARSQMDHELNPMRIDELPEDIGARIFNHLDENSRNKARKVNKHFRRLVRLSTKNFEKIEHIKIQDPNDIKEAIDFYGLCPLQKITLMYNSASPFIFTDAHLQIFIAALKSIGKLDLPELDLIGLNITGLSPLRELTHVRKFTLGSCFEVENLNFLKDWTQLEFLKLGGLMNLSSLEPLAKCTNMRHLTVSACSKVQDLRPTQNWTQMETACFVGMNQPIEINEGVMQWLQGLRRLDLEHAQGLGEENLLRIRTAIEAQGGQFTHHQNRDPVGALLVPAVDG